MNNEIVKVLLGKMHTGIINKNFCHNVYNKAV